MSDVRGQEIDRQLKLAHLDRNHQSLTSKLFSIEWCTYFPLSLPNSNCIVKYVDYETAFGFIKANYLNIFDQPSDDNPFLSQKNQIARLIYYKECGDFFLIYKNSKLIGYFIGTLSDWSTYYIRSTGVLKDYRKSGAIKELVGYLSQLLGQVGVERIEADANINNAASVHILMSNRFIVTGTNFSDRWGTLVRLTRVL